MLRAHTVFDISIDDMEYWRSLGVKGARWLPPLPETALAPMEVPPIPGDIVFSGNLRTPNNLLGLQWLMDEVMPRVWQEAPDARLHVVGSAPDQQMRSRIAAQPKLHASYDVPTVQPFVVGARVLVNPVFIGSGVQLKTLDMLSTDVPIVTRSQALRGLPPELKSMLRVADDAATFADALLAARAAADPWPHGTQCFPPAVQYAWNRAGRRQRITEANQQYGVLSDMNSSSAPRVRLLIVHSSAELYGSDRSLLDFVSLQGGRFDITVLLPESGPLVALLEAAGARVAIGEVCKVQRNMLGPRGLIRTLAATWRAVRNIRPPGGWPALRPGLHQHGGGVRRRPLCVAVAPPACVAHPRDPRGFAHADARLPRDRVGAVATHHLQLQPDLCLDRVAAQPGALPCRLERRGGRDAAGST